MVEITSQPIQSNCRSELIDLLASRFVHEENYHKPSYVNLYQKVQTLFDNIFPDPSVIQSWKYDPSTHNFEIELTQAHQMGNYSSSFHYAPRITGRLELIPGKDRYRVIVEEGIKGSVYSWKRALRTLHLDQDVLHVSLKDSVLWKKVFPARLKKF